MQMVSVSMWHGRVVIKLAVGPVQFTKNGCAPIDLSSSFATAHKVIFILCVMRMLC